MRKFAIATLLLIFYFTSNSLAGPGGYITLVNGTIHNWKRYHLGGYQLNHWNFPSTIKAGESVIVYIEYEDGIFTNTGDTQASVKYELEGTDDKFMIHSRYEHVWCVLENMETKDNPKGSRISLGFKHNGNIEFILFGRHGDYLSTNSKVDDWMHRYESIIGEMPLNKICITGSHDAGMSKIGTSTTFATECNTKTQHYGIYKQLIKGTRYFDIRPVISAGKYKTGHYTYVDIKKAGETIYKGYQGANGQSIDEIISDINSFTKNHKELIILNLSHSFNTDLGNDNYRSFNTDEWNILFKKLLKINHLYISNNPESLDIEKRTLSSFISKSSSVIIIVSDLHEIDSKYYGKGFFLEKDNFHIYNKYSHTNVFDKMRKDQIKKMQEYSPHQYFLLSWTLTQDNTEIVLCQEDLASSIEDLAKEADSRLSGHLIPSVNYSRFPNIIYTDWITNATPALLSMCINQKVKLQKAIVGIEYNNNSNEIKINIYPNPATDHIDVAVTDDTFLQDVVVNVYDVLGTCLLTHPLTFSEGVESVRLDVSGLAAGVYFVRVGGKMYKFVKM